MTATNLPRSIEALDRVYHYTNADGFIGICQSKAIWASDIRLMNDYLEVEYFFDRFHTFLRTMPGVDEFRAVFDDERRPPKAWVFVACFSEKRDLLSQWRAYAGPVGFAIAFLKEHLAKSAQSSGFEFRPVNYNTEATQMAIAKVIDETASSTEFEAWRRSPTDAGLKQACRLHTQQALLNEAVFHKHPAFEEESEWRLCVQQHRLNEAIRYRSGVRGVTPYIPFALEPMQPASARVSPHFAIETILYPGGISNAQFDSAYMIGSQSGLCGSFQRSSCPVVTSS